MGTTQIKANHTIVHVYLADTGQMIHEQNQLKSRLTHKHESCQYFYEQLTAELRRKPRIHSVDSFVHTFPRAPLLIDEFPYPSTTTVYRDIEDRVLELRNSDLSVKLKRWVKGNGNHYARTNKHVLGRSTESRPAEVADRKVLGYWEGDLIKGSRER